jgi:hypothetical protein
MVQEGSESESLIPEEMPPSTEHRRQMPLSIDETPSDTDAVVLDEDETAGARGTGARFSNQPNQGVKKKTKAVPGRAAIDHIDWVIFVPEEDGGVIRPFVTLPSRTQEHIRNTIYAKYCCNDDKKWKRGEAIKHDMTPLMVRKDKRHSYVEEGRCMNNVVVGRAKNKMRFQGSEKVARDICTHVKKPCARMVLDGGQVKLYIYPVASGVRDGLELGDVAFWC